MRIRDLTGQRFGRLVAIEPTDRRNRRSVVWRCQCRCGRSCEVASLDLTSGSVRSCGCLRDRLLTHRGRTRSLRAWARHLGISPSTLHERIEQWGLAAALGTPRIDDRVIDRMERVEAGLAKGQTLTEIAADLGVTKSALSHWLRRNQ